MYEVEIRGLLDKAGASKLKAFLSKNGRYKGTHKRMLIDYTPFSSDKNRDVRVRITDGKPEMIVKVGEWLGDIRDEAPVMLREGELVNAIRLYSHLGYKKGFVIVRRIAKYDYRGIEFSVSEIIKIDKKLAETPGYGFFFEAEIMSAKSAAAKAHRRIEGVLDELGLESMTNEGFAAFVNKMNESGNLLFDADRFDLGLFRKYDK
ncbi:MAG: hypothetical protein KGH60_02250 [Candidatus Micrarchaeota archaeon]|nr:hypothetical protein [Candidatus Micrarchaeota archaeon]